MLLCIVFMMESINGQCLCLVRLSGKVGDEVAIFENHCWFVLSVNSMEYRCGF